GSGLGPPAALETESTRADRRAVLRLPSARNRRAPSRSGRGSSAGGPGPDRSSLSEHVLDAVEEVPFVFVFTLARFELFLGQDLGEVFDDASLFASQLLRRLNLDRREQVPTPAAVHVGQALAAKPQCGAGWCSFRHLDRVVAVERRHLDLAAQ